MGSWSLVVDLLQWRSEGGYFRLQQQLPVAGIDEGRRLTNLTFRQRRMSADCCLRSVSDREQGARKRMIFDDGERKFEDVVVKKVTIETV